MCTNSKKLFQIRALFTACQFTKHFTEFSAFLREWYWSLSQTSKSWRQSRFSWKAFITPRLPSHTINFNLLVSNRKHAYGLFLGLPGDSVTQLWEPLLWQTGNTVTVPYSASTPHHIHSRHFRCTLAHVRKQVRCSPQTSWVRMNYISMLWP